MYTKEIASRYQIDQSDLDTFVLNSDLKYKSTMFNGIEVFEDSQLVVDKYREYAVLKKQRDIQKQEEKRQEEEAREQQKIQKEENKKQLDEMIVTSTSILQGYNVVDYYGIVYKTDKFDNLASSLTLPLIINLAIKDLKSKALALGANAVIGYSISTTKVDARTLLISYGTAVKIEKYPQF